MVRFVRVLIACSFLVLGSCCNEDFMMPEDELDYDFFEGAIDLTPSMNDCSADAAYSTVGATPDLSSAECWDNITPLANRWFKIQAPDTGQLWITINVGDEKGTQMKSQIALWDGDGKTELDCESAYYEYDNLYIGVGDLTIGKYYYLSVDVEDNESRGSFTICVSDSD